MDKLLSILKAIVKPPVFVAIIAVIVGFGGMGASLIVFGGENILTYITYAASAYALTVICVRIPDLIRFFGRIKSENAFLVRYFGDVNYRTRLSLIISLVINTAYTLFQLGLGILHGSAWYYSLFAYYALLVIMRAFLLSSMRWAGDGEKLKLEWFLYRLVAMLLIPMTLALAGVMVFVTGFGRGAVHDEITTIAMAAYTFYAFTHSIISSVKIRRHGSPALSSTKIVGFVSAMVSMLTLEVAMLGAFGGEETADMQPILTGATGAAILIVILAIATNMLIKVSKEIKMIKEKEANGR